jgi:N-methylhydantoinase A
MLLADVVKDYSQTVMLPAREATAETLERLFAPLYDRARADLHTEGLADDESILLPALDMRYVGQSFELAVALRSSGERQENLGPRISVQPALLVEDFHAAHRRRFSYATEGEPVEIVNLRLKAIGHTAKPRFARRPQQDLDPRAAQVGYKQVYFADPEPPHAARPVPAALYERERLAYGNILIGPAVVFQLDSTSLVPPSWAAAVDPWGNLIVEPRGR